MLGRVVVQSYCGASVGNTRTTDFVFVDDAVILADPLKVIYGSQGTT